MHARTYFLPILLLQYSILKIKFGIIKIYTPENNEISVAVMYNIMPVILVTVKFKGMTIILFHMGMHFLTPFGEVCLASDLELASLSLGSNVS